MTNWEEYNKKAIQLFRTGKFSEALHYIDLAISVAEKTYGQFHNNYLLAMENKAQILGEGQEIEAAIALFSKVIKLIDQGGDKHSNIYRRSLNQLASLNKMKGELEVAKSFSRKLLQENRMISQQNMDHVWTALLNLGDIYTLQRNWKEATHYYQQIIQLLENMDFTHAVVYPISLNNLGQMHVDAGNFEEGEKILSTAVNAFHTILNNKKQHEAFLIQQYIITLNNLGNLYLVYLHAPDKSKPYYLESLKMDEILYGGYTIKSCSVLSNLGEAYRQTEEYLEGKKVLSQAASIFEREGKEREGYTFVSHSQGLIALACGEYKMAKEKFKESIKIRELLNLPPNPNTFEALGQAYFLTDNLLQSEENLLSCYQLRKGKYGEDSKECMEALVKLAQVYNKKGEDKKAIKLLERIISNLESKTTSTLDDILVAKLELGIILTESGDFETGSNWTKHVISAVDKNEDISSSTYYSLIRGIGSYFEMIGDIPTAINYQNRALTYYRKIGLEKTVDAISIQNEIGQSYIYLGRYEKAEIQLQNALSVVLEQFGYNHTLYALIANSLGQLYLKTKRFGFAQELFEASIKAYRNTIGENNPYLLSPLINLGTYYLTANKLDLAETYLKKALSLYNAFYSKNTYRKIGILGNLGELYRKQSKWEEAKLHLEEAVDFTLTHRNLFNENERVCLSNLSLTYVNCKEYQKLFKLIPIIKQSVLEGIEHHFVLLSEEEQLQYFSNWQGIVSVLYSLIFEENLEIPFEYLSDIIDLIVETKGIVYYSTGHFRKILENTKSQKLKNDYEDYLKKRRQLAKLDKSANQNEEEARKNLKKGLHSLEEIILEDFKSFVEPVQFKGWKQIRASLQEDEAVVEIIWSRYIRNQQMYSGYIACIILGKKNAKPILVTLPNALQLEREYYPLYKNLVQQEPTRDLKASESTKLSQQDAEEVLFEHFWMPIHSQLSNIKKAYIAPDGIFHHININILKNAQNGLFQIEELEIYRISRAKDLAQSFSSSKPLAKEAFLFGYPNYSLSHQNRTNVLQGKHRHDSNFGFIRTLLGVKRKRPTFLSDLPGTKEEVLSIQNILKQKGWNVQAFLGDEACEEFIRERPSPAILHFATHGFFDDKSDGVVMHLNLNPDDFSVFSGNQLVERKEHPLLNSGIFLAGATQELNNEEEGILTAHDIINFHLHETDLVVLSACNTGIGKIRYGDGAQGLPRAFLVAGAKAVLVSLWEISDKITQQFMVLFYIYLSEVNNIYDAFRSAQLKLKEDYKSPFYWGAFVLISSDKP